MEGRLRSVVIVDHRRTAVGFLTDADEILSGDESTGETKDHIQGDESTQLQPREGRTVDTHPGCLPDNDIGFGGRLGGKTLMQIIDNGKRRAGECHEQEGEKSPARPNEGKRQRDDKVQPTPTDNGKGKRG